MRNLEQMVERFQDGGFGRGLSVRLFLAKAGGVAERELDLSSRQPLKAGDTIRLEVENKTGALADVTILFVDSQFGVSSLFPSDGRTNRIEDGRRITDISGEITEDTLGLEGMIVIAVRAARGSPVADFSFLQQNRLRRTTLMRSAGSIVAKKQLDPEMRFFDQLIQSAGFGARARSTRSVNGGAKAGGRSHKSPSRKTPFKRVTVKSLRWFVGDQ